MQKIFSLKNYGFVAGMEILAEVLRGDFPSLYFFIKPLLMIVLAGYLWQATRLQERRDVLLFVALFFSWLGDCILMLEGEILFLFGLVSFLITHVLYIVIFAKQFRRQGFFVGVLGLLTCYGAGLLGLILPKVKPEMQIPIGVYALVLLAMVAVAAGRKGNSSSTSFRLIFWGAILFMVSDSFIAINRFAFPFQGANIVIMALYIAGQAGIVEGYIQGRSNK